jgi:hypothetical protein
MAYSNGITVNNAFDQCIDGSLLGKVGFGHVGHSVKLKIRKERAERRGGGRRTARRRKKNGDEEEAEWRRSQMQRTRARQ